ncbi:ATP-dependent DNA helicase PIF1 [Striga asiatica]|uniref:ATP-dependent DNA helicase PIF1 n=1 Tax=Striga asiatica TaxID=4170 RepID=A0A5A7NXB5_STRAF|nr:ATP-dependent DNA helicase PIF1 [Striga asiatica]
MVGDFAGKEVFIHRIPLELSKDEQYHVPYKRTQFPVQLSFAMTINKAQGQTLDAVGIYLKEPVISHGQLYVALSRARTAANVNMLISSAFFTKDSVKRRKDIVYKQIKMQRKFVQIKEVDDKISAWTSIVQGTKVSAVVYSADLEVVSKRMVSYKRYNVSNAIVSPVDPRYQVSDYAYKWTLKKSTLMEAYEEPMPPQFPCHIEIQQFQNLYQFADTENLQNIMGVVVHALHVKGTGKSRTRDIVIVNEEKYLARNEDQSHNFQLYIEHKAEVAHLIENKAFMNASVLLPPPNGNHVVTVQEALRSLNKTVQGQVTMVTNQKSLWFSACGHCHTKLEVPIGDDSSYSIMEKEAEKQSAGSSTKRKLIFSGPSDSKGETNQEKSSKQHIGTSNVEQKDFNLKKPPFSDL